MTKAGLDPAKVEACSSTPAATATVDASVKLAKDVNVTQTPTLLVNGRQVPANAPHHISKADHSVPGKAGRHQSIISGQFSANRSNPIFAVQLLELAGSGVQHLLNGVRLIREFIAALPSFRVRHGSWENALRIEYLELREAS